jgi:hypothetical protein
MMTFSETERHAQNRPMPVSTDVGTLTKGEDRNDETS